MDIVRTRWSAAAGSATNAARLTPSNLSRKLVGDPYDGAAKLQWSQLVLAFGRTAGRQHVVRDNIALLAAKHSCVDWSQAAAQDEGEQIYFLAIFGLVLVSTIPHSCRHRSSKSVLRTFLKRISAASSCFLIRSLIHFCARPRSAEFSSSPCPAGKMMKPARRRITSVGGPYSTKQDHSLTFAQLHKTISQAQTSLSASSSSSLAALPRS